MHLKSNSLLVGVSQPTADRLATLSVIEATIRAGTATPLAHSTDAPRVLLELSTK